MGSKYKAKDFIKAIPGSGGIIATIAKRVGCNWTTAKKWVTEYPTVNQAYSDECEVNLDMSESVVLESIKKKNVGDAKWYLSKKGKQRGYVDRQEITGADGNAVPISIIEVVKSESTTSDSNE